MEDAHREMELDRMARSMRGARDNIKRSDSDRSHSTDRHRPREREARGPEQRDVRPKERRTQSESRHKIAIEKLPKSLNEAKDTLARGAGETLGRLREFVERMDNAEDRGQTSHRQATTDVRGHTDNSEDRERTTLRTARMDRRQRVSEDSSESEHDMEREGESDPEELGAVGGVETREIEEGIRRISFREGERKRSHEWSPSNSPPPPPKSRTPEPPSSRRPLSDIEEHIHESLPDNDADSITDEYIADGDQVLDDATSYMNFLSQQVEEKDDTIKKLEWRLNRFTADNQKMIMDRDEELQKLQTEAEQHQAIIEHTKQALSHESSLLRAANEERLTRESEIQDMISEWEAEKANLSEALRRAQKEAAAMQTELEKVESKFEKDMKKAKTDLSLAGAKQEALTKENEALVRELRDANKQLDKMSKDFSSHKRKLATSVSTIKRSGSQMSLNRVLAVGEDDEETHSDEEPPKLTAQEIAQKLKSVAWPKYKQAQSHGVYLTRCKNLIDMYLREGIPDHDLALNLGKDVMDSPLHDAYMANLESNKKLTLDIVLQAIKDCDDSIEKLNPYERFKLVKIGGTENFERFIGRTKTSLKDLDIAPKNEKLATKMIKDQFIAGAGIPSWVANHLEAIKDLKEVALVAENLMRNNGLRAGNQIQPQQNARTTKTGPNVRDLEAELAQLKLDSQFSRGQHPPRNRPRDQRYGDHAVAVMQPKWENAATRAAGANNTQPPVRAYTGFEFQTSNRGTVVCTNCREIGTHQWQHCSKPSYCSICQREGHRDGRHNYSTGNQHPRTRGQWGNQASGNSSYQRSWVSGGTNQAGQVANNGQGAIPKQLNAEAPSFGPYTGQKPKDNEPTA